MLGAAFRNVTGGHQAIPVQVTASRALDGDLDARLIQIDGLLIGEDLAGRDPSLVVSSDGFVFSVLLPNGKTAEQAAWSIGSRIRLTGICSRNWIWSVPRWPKAPRYRNRFG